MMMMIMCSSSSSCGLCFLKINPIPFPRNQTQLTLFATPQSPCATNLQQPNRRNLLNLSILTVILSSTPCKSTWAQTDQLLELQRYTDINEGFTLLRPKSWTKVEKAGATVLFEDPSKGGNNVGVVVTPVRLTTLRDFGDPQFVSNKLIQAEKRKESTKGAEIVSFVERPGQNGGVQVYEFEYKLDSTRGGLKRIFSAAFVASKKLYLLNITQSDSPQQPIDKHRRMMLEQVLHSFDVIAEPLIRTSIET